MTFLLLEGFIRFIIRRRKCESASWQSSIKKPTSNGSAGPYASYKGRQIPEERHLWPRLKRVLKAPEGEPPTS